MVIVITGTDDPMWPFLREAATPPELERLVLFATDDPLRYQLSYSPVQEKTSFFVPDRFIDGHDVSAIWWRRVFTHEMPGQTETLAQYIQKEHVAFMEGLEAALPSVRWISRPSSIARARSKAAQLQTAAAIGFRTPATLFTNAPHELLRFAREEQSIYKAISSPRVSVESDKVSTVFTTLLDDTHLEHADDIASCPGIIQRHCRKLADVRVVVFGTRVFAVRICSQEQAESKTDFRIGASRLRHETIRISPTLERMCVDLTQFFGLRFGAIDLAETESGFVFFEINANGQWGWLEQQTGAPMRRALLDDLFGS